MFGKNMEAKRLKPFCMQFRKDEAKLAEPEPKHATKSQIREATSKLRNCHKKAQRTQRNARSLSVNAKTQRGKPQPNIGNRAFCVCTTNLRKIDRFSEIALQKEAMFGKNMEAKRLQFRKDEVKTEI